MLLNYIMIRIKRILKPILSLIFFSLYLLTTFIYMFVKVLLIIFCFMVIGYFILNDRDLVTRQIIEFINNFSIENNKYVSINIFFITSTIAIYVFLFRERKDINKNFMYGSLQQNIFNLTLLYSLILLFISFFKIDSTWIIYLYLLNLIFFILNVIISFIHTNVYYVTTYRLRFITLIIEGYHENIKSFDKNRTHSTIIICVFFIYELLMSDIKFVLQIISCLFFLYILFINIIFYLIDYNLLFLKSINNRIFSTNTSISYINNDIEKILEKKLNTRMGLYSERLRDLLTGNQTSYDLYLREFNFNNNETHLYLVSIYDNYMTTFKTIILKNKIDDEVLINISRLIYQFTPIVNFNGFLNNKKNRELLDLDKEYSKIYCKTLIEIMIENAKNHYSIHPELYRGYSVQINNDLNEFKRIKNDMHLKNNAINIESVLLSSFAKQKDIINVVEVMSLIIEKKNLNNKIFYENYLHEIIMITIKSIELMNLEISGYLVKIISSNYSSRDINKALNLINQQNINNKINTPKELTKTIRRNNRKTKYHTINGSLLFVMNGSSFEYCFYKAYLLFVMYVNGGYKM